MTALPVAGYFTDGDVPDEHELARIKGRSLDPN